MNNIISPNEIVLGIRRTNPFAFVTLRNHELKRALAICATYGWLLGFLSGLALCLVCFEIAKFMQ